MEWFLVEEASEKRMGGVLALLPIIGELLKKLPDYDQRLTGEIVDLEKKLSKEFRKPYEERNDGVMDDLVDDLIILLRNASKEPKA